MYRQEVLLCPACEGPLTVERGTMPIHGCARCGGLWLGPDATVHVLRGLDDELDHEIDRQATMLEKAARALPPVHEDARSCPFCSQPLSRVDVATTRIDSCFTHGSWFDHSELHQVVTSCARLRLAQREEALFGGFDWGVLWETIGRTLSDR